MRGVGNLDRRGDSYRLIVSVTGELRLSALILLEIDKLEAIANGPRRCTISGGEGRVMGVNWAHPSSCLVLALTPEAQEVSQVGTKVRCETRAFGELRNSEGRLFDLYKDQAEFRFRKEFAVIA